MTEVESVSEETEEAVGHVPSEITYDEQFYPARPRRLTPTARRIARRPTEAEGEPNAENPKYVAWLMDESMLNDANALAKQLSGSGNMLQNPFADPDPRAAMRRAAVWYTAYPSSFLTRNDQTYLSGLADPRLWECFAAVGIEAVHTGPTKRAGGSEVGRRRPRSTVTLTGSVCRSTRSSAPRTTSGRCVRWPRSMAA